MQIPIKTTEIQTTLLEQIKYQTIKTTKYMPNHQTKRNQKINPTKPIKLNLYKV